MRLTYADIKNEIGIPAGLAGDNARLISYLNEASQILWYETDWPGKHVKYRVKVEGNCQSTRIICWPRQLETIESVTMADQPIGLRDAWFEFQENAVGLLDNYMGGNLLADIGESPTQVDVPSDGDYKLKVYCDSEETAGAKILIMGEDSAGNWIRTQDSTGAWQDGEYVVLSADSPTVTENYFTNVTAVHKPMTNNNIRLYALNTSTLMETPIAIYESDETRPIFRRSRLTGLTCQDCTCVTVMGKRRFIPVVKDTDFVYPPSMPALKMGVTACVRRDAGDVVGYQSLMQLAKYSLAKMNSHYRGSGAARSYRFVGSPTGAQAHSRGVQ